MSSVNAILPKELRPIPRASVHLISGRDCRKKPGRFLVEGGAAPPVVEGGGAECPVKARLHDGGKPFVRGVRRCRALTNLAVLLAAELPGAEREAAYRRILRTLCDHIGEPEGASAAIAELLADDMLRAA